MSKRMVEFAFKGLGMMLVVAAFATCAMADGDRDAVPEIDAGSLAAGLTFLTGGLVLLRQRLARKS